MSESFIKRLREERLNTWEQAKALLDTAASEGRDLSAEEDQSYRKMNARLDEIDARVTDVREAHERSKNVEEAFAALMARPAVAPAGQRGAVKDENAEVRSFLRGETGKRSFDVRPTEARVAGGLTVGAATAGGNTVQTSFYDRLIQHLIVNSGLLQAGPTVLATDTGEALQIPKTTAHSSNATIVGEGPTGILAENEPVFGQVTLNSYKYGFLLSVSHELLNDTSVDLMGYLAMQAGRALGNGFGADLVAGNGTNRPNGVLNGASLGPAVSTTAGHWAPTADELIDLQYSVIAPYRSSPSAGWLMNDTTVAVVRKLKDQYGQYVWQPGLLNGSPDTLLSKPLHTDPNMPLTATAGQKSILFGDFSTYFVRQVEGIRFERSDDFAFSSDMVTFRAILRGDGDLVDTTGAIKYFQGSAT